MAREPIRSIQKIGASLLVCIPSEVCSDMDIEKGDLIRFAKGGSSTYTIHKEQDA
jgi:hypothetical protein